ncbi:hypothetical protein PAHAL_2G257100 [Panicum hallii]|uniref:Uncharacterized protein n=1 Tax=Panicum hallii TaxID=206008 RepID=A0A2T8KQC2_9POAL|nr:hypothetical protein PAHAL_2G257100 [Panicum hallii]
MYSFSIIFPSHTKLLHSPASACWLLQFQLTSCCNSGGNHWFILDKMPLHAQHLNKLIPAQNFQSLALLHQKGALG